MYMYTYIHVHVYTVYVDGCGYCTLLFVRTPYSIYICIVIVTYMYMKIHVPSMLAIGIDKHTHSMLAIGIDKHTHNKQTSSHNGFIKH